MKAILHIGTNKTGTTYLQDSLSASRNVLLEQGFAYPAHTGGFNNHKVLLSGLVAHSDLPRHIRRKSENKLVSARIELLTELARLSKEGRTAIISSESLFNRTKDGLVNQIKSDLNKSGVTEFTVVAYVRRPSSHFAAKVQQKHRAAHTIGVPKALPLKKHLMSYIDTFGRANISVRAYDRKLLLNGDITRDFAHHYLNDAVLEDAGIVANDNPSLSSEAVEAIRQYRFSFHHDDENVLSPDGRALMQELNGIDKILNSRPARALPRVADAIDYGSADALWLRDEFGVVFPDFDYGRLERGEFEESIANAPAGLDRLFVFDQERYRTLLALLNETEWSKADRARQKWISSLVG